MPLPPIEEVEEIPADKRTLGETLRLGVNNLWRDLSDPLHVEQPTADRARRGRVDRHHLAGHQPVKQVADCGRSRS
jgi:hypothetical protein